MDIEILKNLPKFAYGDTTRCGSKAGIYFMLDEYNRCWYIGKTKNLKQRLQNYLSVESEKGHKFKENGIMEVAFLQVENHTELSDIEKHYIEIFDPPINDLSRPNRSPVIPKSLKPDEAAKRYLEIKSMIKGLEQELKEITPNVTTYILDYSEDGN